MRSVLYSVAAGVILLPAFACHAQGNVWGTVSFAAGALAVFMMPILEVREPRDERSPLDPWIRPGREG